MFSIIALVFLLNSKNTRIVTDTAYFIKFVITNAGFDVEGTMKINRAQIDFDPDKLNEGYVQIVANASSIKTGIAIRDKHLIRSDYLDATKYPEILLRSKGFSKTGKNKFIGKFDLTLKLITREISIPFTRSRKDDTTFYEGYFEINRLDFDIGESSLTLDETVRIHVSAVGQF